MRERYITEIISIIRRIRGEKDLMKIYTFAKTFLNMQEEDGAE